MRQKFYTSNMFKWSVDTVVKLRTLLEEGKGYAQIADILNTTYDSIRNKTNKLGLKSNDFQQFTVNRSCQNCQKIFIVKRFLPDKFCSQSCAASYNNMAKSTGYRRSKIEIWLEEELSKYYPLLRFDFNKKDTIGSELDIYIPSLKLAIEINGIFHYKAVYGEEKFLQIQRNDLKKSIECSEKGIELHSIDISWIKKFNIEEGEVVLSIIKKIIDSK